MNNELKIKWERIKNLLERENLTGILISKVSNFAWFTGGKINYVGLHTEKGAVSLFITKDKIYLISNNIEYPRIKEEELGDIEFEPVIFNWFENSEAESLKKLTNGKIGTDMPYLDFFHVDLETLHFPLTDEEIERYKILGRETSEVITEVAKEIYPGQREIEIAGLISYKLWERNIIPVVNLVAADERIEKYRHPIPTVNKIKKYVMIVVCGRRSGLIVSLTRIVHFGKISDDLKKKHNAVCLVDAVYINSTCKGKRIDEVFREGLKTYEKMGFPNEWKKHHQGGLTGYMTRYFRASEKIKQEIFENQSYAWNPSITGTKSEDTIITTDGYPVIITEDKNWPLLSIILDGKEVLRPDILER